LAFEAGRVLSVVSLLCERGQLASQDRTLPQGAYQTPCSLLDELSVFGKKALALEGVAHMATELGQPLFLGLPHDATTVRAGKDRYAARSVSALLRHHVCFASSLPSLAAGKTSSTFMTPMAVQGSAGTTASSGL
jgi:hypothetical protein